VTDIERAFLIADLSGYTALTAAHGNLEAAKTITRYVELAREALEADARLVERVGDELLIVAERASSAILTAVRLRAAVDAEPLFPTVRAGLHVGHVLEQAGEYFGAGLNIAARVAAHARPGQILCTARVAAEVVSIPGVACRALGDVRFKNVPAPLAVFEIVAGSARERPKVLDPVCRMQVEEDTAPGRIVWRGVAHHFCSLDCARTFLERPDEYTPGGPGTG
jgi:class 3 adenylate cyclase/YHS domain-containing protein